MSIESIVKTTNTQLDKAKDFRYLALLGSFVLMLDLLLVYRHGMSLSELTIAFRHDRLPLGEALIFLLAFVVFISSFTAAIQALLRIILSIISLAIPANISRVFSDESKINREYGADFVSIESIRKASVRDDNRTAYAYVMDYDNTKDETEQLYYYSLSFSLSILFSFYAHLTNQNSLVSKLISIHDVSDSLFLVAIYKLFSVVFIFSIFYLAIFRGCVQYLELNNRVKIPGNKF